MQCTSCHYQIEDPEALFCAQCGKSLCREGHCYFCGKRLPAEANYCDRCGAAVTATPGSTTQPQSTPSEQTGLTVTEPTPPSPESDANAIKVMIANEIRRRFEEAQIQQRVENTRQKERDEQARLQRYGLSENDWVRITGGTFLMGSPESEPDRFSNEQQHEVQIGDFEMLKTPVTFKMFDIFCDDDRRTKPPSESWGRENRPVININYWSAVDYCHWLSDCIDRKVRLPTEAEWEYACRAGTTTPFWTGQSISPSQANFDANYTYGDSVKGVSRQQTTPVDQFPPNPWGLHDMHGNVWEWCASVFEEEYNGAELQDAGSDPDERRERVIRGGSWHNVPAGIRSAIRNKLMPNYHYHRVGFRIVREIEG